MDTGAKIKLLREQAGMTQEELGNRLGVKRAAINKYETGLVVNLKRSTIENLCRIFDVTPQYLLTDSVSSESTPVAPQPMLKISHEERLVLALFDELNDEGKANVLDYLELLAESGKYKKRDCSDMEEKTTA